MAVTCRGLHADSGLQRQLPGPKTGRTSFPAFPYKPYEIQQGFMEAVYRTASSGGVGLFESPTGTGKTLSLICAALQWLQDAREQIQTPQALPSDTTGNAMPDWLMQGTDLQHDRLSSQQPQRKMSSFDATKHKPLPGATAKNFRGDHADEKFLLPEYHDADPGAGQKRPVGSDDEEGPQRQPQDKPPRHLPQIIFCSRTHSQLAQVVGELRRTPFANSMSMTALASRRALCINDNVLRLSNTARINEACLELQKTKTKQRKKDNILGAAAADAGSQCKCPFSKAPQVLLDGLQAGVEGQPLDVEELARLGRAKGLCPYYAARAAQQHADLVLLPYNALLVQETRQALGVSLEGAVIVIDEAHNLVSAVNASHSASVSCKQLQLAHAQLSAYLERFVTRLAPGNSQHIKNLITLTHHLQDSCMPPAASYEQQGQDQDGSELVQLQRINEFLFAASLDGMNMFQLIRYVRDSKVLFKVAGYADAAPASKDAAGHIAKDQVGSAASATATEPSHGAALQAVVAFAQALTHADSDGRIVLDTAAGCLNFISLNAAAHFAPVVKAAQAVILASGTLSPIQSLCHQLFPGSDMPASVQTPPLHAAVSPTAPSAKLRRSVRSPPPAADSALHPGVPSSSTPTVKEAVRLTLFSCGHIVPANRLLCLPVGQGPTGVALDLRHRSRGEACMLDELGRLLLNVCQAVLQGVVAFFPSYAFADQAIARWTATGALGQLSGRTTVFQEPKAAGEVEALLQQYAAAATGVSSSTAGLQAGLGSEGPGLATGQSSGALLLCVVGGKLAEGINFGDGLGRCVVMLGMPYPNPRDPELRERMRYLDAQQLQQRQVYTGLSNPSAGQAYYEDLCMNAVNQCIGRVIRHANDWAAILLADARWAAPSSSQLHKLPAWIQASVAPPCASFGAAYAQLHRFSRTMSRAK